MVQQNENYDTASRDSDTQMSAVGGQCSHQVSLSIPSTKCRVAEAGPYNGVGNVTAVRVLSSTGTGTVIGQVKLG
ncbi:hypothetical protein FWK35_00033935 [Aphis craccivora]|uniref:Uncharacterized protein n=1 Tax=Aphis craccivora TaxID=307492 RepID=A0A6G0W1P7_APHCR|nr:hypothetical protein FWK35_00033935 [Aphis craccivora]